jgi:hypothetical protein
MMHLLQGILRKAFRRALKEFRCHRQIDLRGRAMHVPQGGRQVGPQLWHVRARLIPRGDATHREAVAQIMSARLVTRAIGALNACGRPQASEAFADRMLGEPCAISPREERRTFRCRGLGSVVRSHIVGQDLIASGTKWDEPCFMELGVSDREEGDGRIVV